MSQKTAIQGKICLIDRGKNLDDAGCKYTYLINATYSGNDKGGW